MSKHYGLKIAALVLLLATALTLPMVLPAPASAQTTILSGDGGV